MREVLGRRGRTVFAAGRVVCAVRRAEREIQDRRHDAALRRDVRGIAIVGGRSLSGESADGFVLDDGHLGAGRIACVGVGDLFDTTYAGDEGVRTEDGQTVKEYQIGRLEQKKTGVLKTG